MVVVQSKRKSRAVWWRPHWRRRRSAVCNGSMHWSDADTAALSVVHSSGYDTCFDESTLSLVTADEHTPCDSISNSYTSTPHTPSPACGVYTLPTANSAYRGDILTVADNGSTPTQESVLHPVSTRHYRSFKLPQRAIISTPLVITDEMSSSINRYNRL